MAWMLDDQKVAMVAKSVALTGIQLAVRWVCTTADKKVAR